MIIQGGWELDESLEEAALRESLEEAGVIGLVEVLIRFYLFILYKLHFYILIIIRHFSISYHQNQNINIFTKLGLFYGIHIIHIESQCKTCS